MSDRTLADEPLRDAGFAQDSAEINLMRGMLQGFRDNRIWLGQDALHVAVAVARVSAGAIAERPDGSFGIKLDA